MAAMLTAALVVLLLLAPVVNPWYWLWALPLSLLAGQRALVLVAVVAVLSYLNSSVLGATGWGWFTGPDVPPYSVAWPLALVQLLVWAGAAGWDWTRANTPARAPRWRAGAFTAWRRRPGKKGPR
jgi:hypothetical protein